MDTEDCRSRIIRPGEWEKAAKYFGQLVALGDTEEQVVEHYEAGQLRTFTQINSSLNFCYGTQNDLGRYLIPTDKLRHVLYLSEEEWRKLVDVLPQEVLDDDSE